MKGIVLSDIHGDITAAERIISYAWDDPWLRDAQGNVRVDAYFFLGDGVRDFARMESFLRRKTPNAIMYDVKGNNDFGAEAPYSRVVHFGGASIYMTHGHKENVKMTMLSLDYAAQEAGCSIALYGHTHCPDDETRRTRMINPGAANVSKLALISVENGTCDVKFLAY